MASREIRKKIIINNSQKEILNLYPQFKLHLSKRGKWYLEYRTTNDLCFILKELEFIFMRYGVSINGEINYLGEQIDDLLGTVYHLFHKEQ